MLRDTNTTQMAGTAWGGTSARGAKMGQRRADVPRTPISDSGRGGLALEGGELRFLIPGAAPWSRDGARALRGSKEDSLP